MKTVISIHGWGGYPNEGWRPWLKDELAKKNIIVINPAMPKTDNPKEEEWVNYLHEVIKNPNEDLILLGHSLGAITILRYIERLNENEKIEAAIFVAGFTNDLGFKELSNFFTKPIEWEKIKSHCDKFIIVYSDNDPIVPTKYATILKDKLDGVVLEQHNMKHFSGDDGITMLPVVRDEVLKLLNRF
jgi:uncharacterized protein